MKKYFADKEAAKQSSGGLDSGKTTEAVTVATGGLVKTTSKEAYEEKTRELTTKWLVYNHVAFNVIESDEFYDLLTHLNPSYVRMHRNTFIKRISLSKQLRVLTRWRTGRQRVRMTSHRWQCWLGFIFLGWIMQGSRSEFFLQQLMLNPKTSRGWTLVTWKSVPSWLRTRT